MEQVSPPRLPGLPVLGHLLDFRKRQLQLQLRLRTECGDFGLFQLGPQPAVGVCSVELAQEVLVERAADFKKSRALARFAKPILGEGLLTAETELHRRQRRLIAPVFQHKRIAAYAEVMSAYAERSAARLTDGATIALHEEMSRLTLGIVGKTLFDADVEADAEHVGHALTVALNYVTSMVSTPFPVPFSWPTPANRRTRKALKDLDAMVYRVIGERRALSAAGAERSDALSMLLAARDESDGQGMSDAQVRDEVLTIFLAGHETTANALSFTFHLLAQNPDVLQKLVAEVDTVLGGRTPRFEDLPNLRYTLQVFKEGMRLYPPAYLVGRETLRPVTIGGYALAKNTLVFVNIFTMHRRPDYFPDPERFDPDRFLPEAEASQRRGIYMPFGGGARICIGNHFALMAGQIILATFVQRMRFEALSATVEPETLVTLRPVGGVPMRVHRRYSASHQREKS
jgi:cytochrome P450